MTLTIPLITTLLACSAVAGHPSNCFSVSLGTRFVRPLPED